MKKTLFALCLLAAPCLMAQEQPPTPPAQIKTPPPGREATYRLVYDPSGKGGMESGVVLLSNVSALAYRGIFELADTAGMNSRWFLRPVTLALIVNSPTPGNMIHEYYGHGAALREYGFGGDTKYKWGYFMGSEGKTASDRIQTAGTYEAKQQWIAGGIGSTQLYLLEYEKEMYRSGRMNLLAVKPLFQAAGDLSYLSDGLDPENLDGLNDGASWLTYFKAQHGNDQGLTITFADKSKDAVSTARTMDPALYWAAATVLHYLWTGDDGFYAPALPLAGLRFGFSPKVNLTPIGPENYYYLFIARKGTLASLYLRSGEAPEGKFSGWGAELGPVNVLGVGLTPGYDKWEFPAGVSSPQLPSAVSGYAAHLKLDLPVYKAVGLTGKATYKTKGYLLGQPSGEGYSGYAGLSLTF